MSKKIQEMKKQLREEPKSFTGPDYDNGLSIGSTLLNLAATGKISIGLVPGSYLFFVGDSASGKSFLCLTCLAEAAKNPKFDDYRFIYDDGERGIWMDLEKFFGKKMVKRLEQPGPNGPSETVEDFYYNLENAFNEERPFIYVRDSMDSLESEVDQEKFLATKKAKEKGKEEAGSYGTAKAKINSAGIRRVINRLQEKGSILILISQTRDRIGFGFEPRTRSGGRALRFYSHLEIWTSIRGLIRKTVRGEQVEQGIIAELEVKKNRFNGRLSKVEVPIYWSVGIDDTGSMIDYLVKWKHWQAAEKGGKINAKEFGLEFGKEKLVEEIEAKGLVKDLRLLVADVWNDVEENSRVTRLSRYE